MYHKNKELDMLFQCDFSLEILPNLVKFFFSEWIENNCLKSYFELKDPFKFDCKTSDFIEACRDIEQYILETCEVSKI